MTRLSKINMIAALVAFILFGLVALIRPVQAEDDCGYLTFAVVRLPVIGLVCVIETPRYY